MDKKRGVKDGKKQKQKRKEKISLVKLSFPKKGCW